MNLRFNFEENVTPNARMKVVGVGGGGCNAVNRMIEASLTGVEFISVNTDVQALDNAKSSCRLQIGRAITRGLGAGADPEVGRKSIEEDREAVIDSLEDSDMIFITAGMGGGTGTGAAPVVAEIAKDLGALTVAIVTKPFIFEGPKRIQRAEEGIAALKEEVDTLIIIPNQRLLSVVAKGTPLTSAFRTADEVLLHATKGISDLISIPGLINLDFADVKTVMREMGDALMGSAVAAGEERSVEAARKAIASPLLEDVEITGAQGVLVNITGGESLSLHEVNDATTVVSEAAGDEANLIFGAVIDPSMEEEVRVTVIATGFNKVLPNHFGKTMRTMRIIDTELQDLDVPAYQRRNGNGNGAGNGRPAAKPAAATNGQGSSKPEPDPDIEDTLYNDEDDLESPAYIRRRWKR